MATYSFGRISTCKRTLALSITSVTLTLVLSHLFYPPTLQLADLWFSDELPNLAAAVPGPGASLRVDLSLC